MFAVVRAAPPRRGIAGRLWEKLMPVRATAADQKLAGLSYILVDVRRRWDGSIPWEAVASAAQVHLLPPDGEVPPEYLPQADETALERTLLLDLARRLLSGSDQPPARRTAVLLDPRGTAQPLALPLLEVAGTLRVCTLVPDAWAALTEELLEERGAFLQVGGVPGDLEGSTLVLAPDGWDALLQPPASVPVLASRPVPVRGRCLQFTGLEPAVPPELAAGLPAGTSPARFLAAAYGDGQSLPVPLRAARMRCGPQWVTSQQVEEAFRRRRDASGLRVFY